jgi:DNA-nicking Smr family endonuclease
MKEEDRELNVRGCTVAEARRRLRRFLDEAADTGERRVKIIHGKGMASPGGVSVVRAAIRRDLEQALQEGRIRDFRLGNPGEGGAGVSIIWL